MDPRGVADRELIDALRGAMLPLRDPERAVQQAAYMKSAMPFYGLTRPVMRTTIGPLLRERKFGERAEWEATVRALFDEATHREERYAALTLLRQPRYRSWRDVDVLPLVRHIAETGAWWDLVDEVSSVAGDALLADREQVSFALRQWAEDECLWVRRIAIIAQLGHRAQTDTDLLTDAIEPNIADREFFIRKAIGWALRVYAKTEPGWVGAFVVDHPELSGLSRREALKHL